jgi:uncharacterized protein YggE
MKAAIAGILIGFVLAVGAMAINGKWLAAKEAPAAPSQITVTGESRLVGEPDTAEVSFALSKTAKTVTAAQDQASDAIRAVIAALGEAGVKKEDIDTSRMSVDQDWDYGAQRSKSFRVASMVTVTVHNVQHVGRVVDTAVAHGLPRLTGVQYDVRSPKWRDKGMREALANARERAEAMAKGVSRPLGRVVSVRERAEWQRAPGDYAYGWAEGSSISTDRAWAMPRTRSLPGQRALKTEVEVVYELR